MWTPLRVPRKLREDNDIYYRDRNAAHYPKFPIEPTVEAILQVHPTSDTVTTGEPIDIFACASTLGNLFRFVNGNHLDFRVLVERVDDTVHLIRREKSPLETIPDVRGYGHSFPESYTTWDPSVSRSSSHQRVILYRFGGLTCFVRFEGDGYLPDKAGTPSPYGTTGDDILPPKSLDPFPVEDLVSELSVSSNGPLSGKAALQISKAGRPIPQAAVFDLKTRSIRRKSDEAATVEGEMLRLWLKQIPNLVLAYHTAGTFHDIQIRDVRADVAKWEETNKNKIACFAKLLSEITEFTRGRKNGKLEISCNEGDDTLCLTEQTADTQPALSSSVASRWKTWLSGARSPDYTACDDECRYCGQCAY